MEFFTPKTRDRPLSQFEDNFFSAGVRVRDAKTIVFSEPSGNERETTARTHTIGRGISS